MGSATSVHILPDTCIIFKRLTSLVHPERKSTLPLALLACVKRPLLAAVLPRLFLIIFRYSQPILIKQSIRFVLLDSTSRIDYGYWLVVSAIVIYIGLAVSSSRVRSIETLTVAVIRVDIPTPIKQVEACN